MSQLVRVVNVMLPCSTYLRPVLNSSHEILPYLAGNSFRAVRMGLQLKLFFFFIVRLINWELIQMFIFVETEYIQSRLFFPSFCNIFPCRKKIRKSMG